MSTPLTDHVISEIYCGVRPSGSWLPALIAIGDLLKASSTSLRISRSGAAPHEFLLATGAKVQPQIVREWEAERKFTPDVPPVGQTKVTAWKYDEPTNPVANELSRYDVAVTLSHCFDIDDTTKYALYLTRAEGAAAFSAGEIKLVERISGHLRTAVRLRRDGVRSHVTSMFQAQAMDQLGVAGLLLDPFGAVMPLNQAAETMLGAQDCLALRHNRLAAIDRASDRDLQKAIAGVLAGGGGSSRSVALSLSRASGARPIGAVVSAADAVSLTSNRVERCALIFVRDSETEMALEPEMFQKLFSFTPAEANLAIGLANGMCLEDIEGHLNIRHNTARAHLRSMFLKADVNRQSELVHLLASSVPPLCRARSEMH